MFKGTIGLPPTTSPPAAKGKTIYWISCGQQAPDCEAEAAAGKQAAEAIGWHVVIGDANLNQANGNQTAIRTAVAAHPDAIVEDAFSCATAEQALEAAKAANIPVLGLETLDCTVSGGPQLFTVPMIYSAADRTFAQYWQAFAGVWNGSTS